MSTNTKAFLTCTAALVVFLGVMYWLVSTTRELLDKEAGPVLGAPTVLTAPQGGTGLSSYTRGDIITATSSNTLIKLGAGATGTVLTMASGLPSWVAPSGGTITSSTWQFNETDSTIYPTTSTFDVLIGGSTSGVPFLFDVAGSLSVARLGAVAITGTSTFGSFGGFPTPFHVNTPNSDTTWNTIMTNSNATNSYGFNVGNIGQFGIYSNEPGVQDVPFLFIPTSTWKEAGLGSSGFPAPGVYLGGISTSHTVPYTTDSMNLGHAALSFHDFYASGTAYVAKVISSGSVTSTFAGPVSSTRVWLGYGSAAFPALGFTGTGGAFGLYMNGPTQLAIGAAGAGEVFIDSGDFTTANQFRPLTNGSLDNGLPTAQWRNGYYLGQVSSTGFLSINATSTNATTTNFYAATTARLPTDTLINETTVCLSDGTNCPAGSGVTTLQQAIAANPSATSTPTFLGGVVVASSTATGTLNLPSQFATALLFTDSSRAVSSTSRITVNGNTGSVTSTNLFASVASSTSLFSNTAGIGTLTAGNLAANQGTSTILSWISASGSTLLVSGQTVCLANGTNCPVASLTVAGLVEIATSGETSAGTDATRAVSPDGLSQSVFGSKTVEMYLTTSTGAFLAVNSVSNTSTCFVVQAPLNGMNLTAVHAQHGVAGSSGTSTQIQVRNETDSVDMLTVPIHIDPGERGSNDATTQPVINGSTDDVATFDRICADVDAVEDTPGKETILSLTFSLP